MDSTGTENKLILVSPFESWNKCNYPKLNGRLNATPVTVSETEKEQ